MPLFRRFFSYFLALLFTCTLVLMGILFFQRDPRHCPTGHLATLDKCMIERGLFTWRQSGWWFAVAEGPVSTIVCKELGKAPPEIELPRAKIPRKFLSRPCKPFLGESGFTRCYAHSRMSGNGNTRFFGLLATDEACQRGLYFEGSKRALESGKVKEMPLDEPSSIYPLLVEPPPAKVRKPAG